MDLNEHRIIIAGFGGQGVVVVGNILARAAVIEDKNVCGMVCYGAEMRGGTANSSVVISDDEIFNPQVNNPTASVILNQPSLDRFEPLIRPGGTVLTNTSIINHDPVRTDLQIIRIAATQTALDLGNLKVANMVAIGAFIEHTGILKVASIEQAIKDLFSGKNPKLVDINLQALHAGAEKSTSVMPVA